VYAYVILKMYVYTFIKTNNISGIAMVSVLIDAVALVGYLNGL